MSLPGWRGPTCCWSPDRQRRWYRYHHLFQSFTAELDRREAELILVSPPQGGFLV